MAQIVLIQPAAPQPPPPGPPASGEQQQFSPHFEKAMARQRDQVTGRENDKAGDRTIENGQKSRSNDQIASPPEGNAGNDVPSAVATATAEEDAPLEQNVTFAAAKTQQEVAQISLPLSAADQSSPLYFFPPGTLLLVDRFENTQLPTVSPGSPANPGKVEIVTPPLAASLPDSLADSFQFSPALTEAPSPAGQPPVVPSAGGDKLLLQLQQLIDSSDETGIVAITSGDNSRRVITMPNGIFTALTAGRPADTPEIAVPTPGEVGEVDGNGPLAAIAQSLEAPAAKGNQGLSSLRHTTEQQYFEAKIDLQKSGENDAASPDSRQGNEFGQQAATGPGVAAPAGVAAEQTNTFAQPLAVAQEGQALPTSESLRPLTLPSGAIVQQEAVFQQVIDRFQIARRALDTQINIKLHPAELGEVNINLSVKEGAIRANVVAQSQHVQEILEKNMGKLRTVLEHQGFTIEELTVTAKSDAVGDFNLFDRQLFSQSDYTPPSPNTPHTSDALFNLEDPGTEKPAANAGVNVKI
jgi:hypothetical protein